MVKSYNGWLNSSLNESVQFPTDHDKIERILDEYGIKDYLIGSDGTVDVNGNVDLTEQNFKYFPVKFGFVEKEFDCSWSKNLKSLKGAPKECEEFMCSMCNSLETLEGAPEKCNYFNCSYCKHLKTLEGAPEKCRIFYCNDCKNLQSLEGGPKECNSFITGSSFNDGRTMEKLITLKGVPKKCKRFNCSRCKNLKYSFKYFPKCKEINVEKTCFEKLYNVIGNDIFIKLVNTKSDFEFEAILAVSFTKELNFEKYIKPLLKDKTMTEEAFKYKYRGAVAGERFRF